MFEYGVRSDFVRIGEDDCGEAIVGYEWFIIAEDTATGRRFAHDYVERTRWEEEPQAVARLLAAVKRAAVDPRQRAHWDEIEPAYGSRFWQGWVRENLREGE
jgi:hypothetical protein